VKNVKLGLVHSGVEGSDFSQSFQEELGMATKPGISVLAMNEDLAILTCVCNQVVPTSSTLAYG